jgi:hypothetical protein
MGNNRPVVSTGVPDETEMNGDPGYSISRAPQAECLSG